MRNLGSRLFLLAATAALALGFAACGDDDGNAGDSNVQDPEGVKSCLEAVEVSEENIPPGAPPEFEARLRQGWDTSSSTGVKLFRAEGREIEFRDEFIARAPDGSGTPFLLWFFHSETDAEAFAKGYVVDPSGRNRVEGSVVLWHARDANRESLQTVEDCLGL
jgi:hypothetical protein